ncbi:MAG: DNA repair protein RecN, partial [Bacteroidota bacterium]
NGLTIITGETGAGKSILLGGLSLVLGKRADLSQVKDTTKKCIVEAVFDITNYDLQALFSSEDLDYETQTIIRREILPSGKSRAFVNDTPVTLDILGAISSHLIDIHSQHQTLQLTDDTYQFKVIDALAENDELLNTYTNILKQYKTESHALEALKATKSEALKEYDYNSYLLEELKSAQLVDDELEQLEESYEQLNNVELITEKLAQAKAMLNTEDIGVVDALNELKRQFNSISEFGKDYEAIQGRIESAIIELDDILTEIDILEGKVISDPEELECVSHKLQLINTLLSKHNVNEVSELIQLEDELSKKVLQTEHIDEYIAEKETIINQFKQKLDALASEIHDRRQTAIPQFAKNLEEILSTLGMPNAKFKIELSQTESYKYNGIDTLQFLFTANKGASFTELKKAASGGELSRIMLAVKSILAQYVQLPTIMFDEIDTGVSGEISNKMGDIMKVLSKNIQVFTITHLPQIAAKGDTHFKVFKTDTDNTTRTNMTLLSQEERIVEIAQMLGGVNVSDSAIAHAKQLLN